METHIGHLTQILHWCTHQTITNALEDMELTASQGRIMGYVSHCTEPPCPKDVEEEFQLSHPTVSGILSRMEQKGFLQLRPDPRDRRCKRIYIMAKGRNCNEKMHQTILATEERLVQGFSLQEREQFVRLLKRAIDNMGDPPCHMKSKEESKE